MEIIKPMQQGIMTRTFVQNRRYYLSVASLSYFPFHNPVALGTEQEMWAAISNTCDKDMTFDICMPKARSEVLMIGKCFAPNNNPVAKLFVDLDFGPILKRVVVYGNRYWKKGDASQGALLRYLAHDWEISKPEPFLEMDIGWKNAFGGKGFEENPWGKGYFPKDTGPTLDNRSPLPNVERPESMIIAPSSIIDPTGYGPIEALWPRRARKVGKKYGKKWEKERFPEPAEDMDPSYYNAAPQDQQLKEGYWKGNEKFVITNMHPEHPEQKSSLPQIRPRCFVLQKYSGTEKWSEINLRPETVWLLPNIERGILISRGVFETDTYFGIDIDALLLAWELQGGQRRSSENYRKSVQLRQDEDTAKDWSIREDDLSPPEGIPEEPAIFLDEDEEIPQVKFGPLLDRMKKTAEGMLDKAKELALSFGLDPATYLDQAKISPLELPIVPKLEKMSDISALLEFANSEEKKSDIALQEMEKQARFASKTKDEARKKIEAEAREICKRCGEDYDKLMAHAKANPNPPKPALARAREVLENTKKQLADYPDKLAEIDAALVKIDSAQVKVDAAQAEIDMKAMALESAHYEDPPEEISENTSQKLRNWVEKRYAAGEGFGDADLSGVDLSSMNLAGADFKGIELVGANFSQTDLSNADLSEAILARANFTDTKLVGANLKKANIGKAIFLGADLSETKLNKAIIDQTNFTKSILKKTEMGIDMCLKSDFTGADLSEAYIAGVDFIESKLNKTNFRGSDLTKASFAMCDMEGADFSLADLTETMFAEVQAPGSHFHRAKMKDTSVHMDSVFSKASFTEIESEGLNLAQTDLTGANFFSARLKGADFGESSLVGANFEMAVARESNFTYADLTEANFIKADLMNASFTGATLVKANFLNAHLFGADVTFANREGAQLLGSVIKRTAWESE